MDGQGDREILAGRPRLATSTFEGSPNSDLRLHRRCYSNTWEALVGHDASDKAVLAFYARLLVDKLTPSMLCDPDGHLLDALRPNSVMLRNITDMFVPMMKKPACSQFTRWVNVDSIEIVRESLPAPILDGTERRGLPYDHRNMCRLEGRTLPEYKAIVAALVRYALGDESVVAGR
ncbi:uncharacterized protein A1O5_11904 [Cladophialophora psammophila CBS 110553]|uniref:Uncharacterized protein n=1 Tax=Cladophialophora psammophila CBS 110553 TaxID=1182543 RepID=W9WA12_9EURO|nr:uncharacterized protein A1O5_11904 [Cladophialophora psammophila CBS 110553]EXJ61346.1 hypothetical protein A1O5_11904 [Cladophialophora psammophila CBS 110553]